MCSSRPGPQRSNPTCYRVRHLDGRGGDAPRRARVAGRHVTVPRAVAIVPYCSHSAAASARLRWKRKTTFTIKAEKRNPHGLPSRGNVRWAEDQGTLPAGAACLRGQRLEPNLVLPLSVVLGRRQVAALSKKDASFPKPHKIQGGQTQRQRDHWHCTSALTTQTCARP